MFVTKVAHLYFKPNGRQGKTGFYISTDITSFLYSIKTLTITYNKETKYCTCDMYLQAIIMTFL